GLTAFSFTSQSNAFAPAEALRKGFVPHGVGEALRRYLQYTHGSMRTSRAFTLFIFRQAGSIHTLGEPRGIQNNLSFNIYACINIVLLRRRRDPQAYKDNLSFNARRSGTLRKKVPKD